MSVTQLGRDRKSPVWSAKSGQFWFQDPSRAGVVVGLLAQG